MMCCSSQNGRLDVRNFVRPTALSSSITVRFSQLRILTNWAWTQYLRGPRLVGAPSPDRKSAPSSTATRGGAGYCLAW